MLALIACTSVAGFCSEQTRSNQLAGRRQDGGGDVYPRLDWIVQSIVTCIGDYSDDLKGLLDVRRDGYRQLG